MLIFKLGVQYPLKLKHKGARLRCWAAKDSFNFQISTAWIMSVLPSKITFYNYENDILHQLETFGFLDTDKALFYQSELVLKDLMLITFSSPRAQPEAVQFLILNESPYFSSLVANPKFQLQIPCSFGDMTKNVKFIGIPENNFLCFFIIASSPGVHTFFCLWRVNKKLPQDETSQLYFRGQGQSIKSEKYTF